MCSPDYCEECGYNLTVCKCFDDPVEHLILLRQLEADAALVDYELSQERA
jgi:hypothetical protein